jgi:hypothetical protein
MYAKRNVSAANAIVFFFFKGRRGHVREIQKFSNLSSLYDCLLKKRHYKRVILLFFF